MKKQQRRDWEQLDLRLPDKSLEQSRTLDLEIRHGVTKLLGLLLIECAGAMAMTKEVSDEQDHH